MGSSPRLQLDLRSCAGRSPGTAFLDDITMQRVLAACEWPLTSSSSGSSLFLLSNSTKVLEEVSLTLLISSLLFLFSEGSPLEMPWCWTFTGTPVGVRNRPSLPANFWEIKGLDRCGLDWREQRIFWCSFSSCSNSVRMQRGDLLTPVIGFPIRFKWPRTWLDSPVLVSNQPRHRGQVCSVWDSGLSVVKITSKINYIRDRKCSIYF